MLKRPVKQRKHLSLARKNFKTRRIFRANGRPKIFSKNGTEVFGQNGTVGISGFISGSREQGAVWQVIASNLNCHKDLFEVTARSVRDRFTLFSRRHKSKTSRELKGSGTSGEELTENEILIEDMIALSEESDKKGGVRSRERKSKRKC